MVDALESRVILFQDLYSFWIGFWTLSGTRSVGFGASPIQLSEIKAYFDLFDIEKNEFYYRRKFIERITEMDRAYLEFASNTSKSKKKEAKKKR